ncbi:MAG: hypothetical protein L0219_13725 [Phycisphaerales bacterium]|nr:hypothetical protein [Phycisphaerales bacterium]
MTNRTETTNTNRRLPKGTLVVNSDDGESGRIIEVCTFRRNGIDAFSYVVQTAYGREVWEVGELFVPEPA